MKLNILNAKGERAPRLLQSLVQQGIDDFELWHGVHSVSSVKKSINLGHKEIVEYARIAGWPCVTICEDDIEFSHPNSWNYYLSQLPKDYDIFLGMVFLGDPDANGIVKDFTGLTLYTVHQNFYNTLLSMPDDEHLDRALSGHGLYKVCHPFVCTQYAGFSSNTGKHETYDVLTANRQFYLGH